MEGSGYINIPDSKRANITSELVTNVDPVNADLLKERNKGAQDDEGSLSLGAKLLFEGVKTKLSVEQKNQIFQKLDFFATDDKTQLFSNKSEKDNEAAYFKPNVDVMDLNNDGIEEVFVHWGNFYTSGNVGTNVTLLIKKGNSYDVNFGFGGIAHMINQYTMSYPDIMIGGPGYDYPIWRWNGNKYLFYKRINPKSVEYGRLKFTTPESVKDL